MTDMPGLDVFLSSLVDLFQIFENVGGAVFPFQHVYSVLGGDNFLVVELLPVFAEAFA